jgi:hypothetical protein
MNANDYREAQKWSGLVQSPIAPTPRPDIKIQSPKFNVMPVAGIIIACGVIIGAALGIAGV